MRLKALLVAIALCATGCKGCDPALLPPHADEVSPMPISTQPSIAIDARGRAVVGWYSGVVGGNNTVHARRLEKGTWTELGGLGDPKEFNGPVDVAIGANDEPVAAWCAGKVPSVLRVAAWNGKAWNELPGADDRHGRALLPSVAASADGRVAVAWFDEVGVAELGVRQWISGAWSTLPSPVRGPGLAHTLGWPSIALDASGAVVLAWSAPTPGGSSIFVARWDGARWVGFGPSLTGGGISAVAGESTRPRLALGPSGPVVGWIDGAAGRRNAYVRRWTGAAWDELAGSASGKGLSTASATTVAVAVDRAGEPEVSWGEGDEDTQDILLRGWSGSAWGKAGGLGSGKISAPGTFSVLPAIAATPAQICVAWTLYNGDRIVARCAAP
jgi:hypothetical protein